MLRTAPLALRAESLAVIILLTGLTAVTPLSIDMPLPALPMLAKALSAPADQAQLLVGVFLVGFACAQLVAGPLSDRFGRRPILLIGLAAYFVLSAAAAVAPNLETLLTIRLFQGIAACAAPVAARAIVADIHEGPAAQRAMSIVTAGMGFAPVLAPSIGALVLEFTDWRGIFWALTASAALLLVCVWLFLQETRPTDKKSALNIAALLRQYFEIGTARKFLDYALPSMFAGGGLFTFLSAGTFVLQEDLGVETREFGIMFAGVMLGFVCGATLAGIFSPKLGIDKSILLGLVISTTGGSAMLALWLAGISHWAAIILPMACVMFGMGILRPNSIAGAMAGFRHVAGAASALIGFFQMAAGATAGLLLLLLPYQPGDVMPILVAIYPALSLFIFTFMRSAAAKAR
jgi:DHA1 family bicyclomycin/chloramphenicol resistance-like MFS transporter